MNEKSTFNNDGLMFADWMDSGPSDLDYDEDAVGSSDKPKLDIFETMKQADRKNLNYLEQQTPKMAASFTPLVAMRWFSAVADNSPLRDYHLIITNEILNKNFWVLSKYPELQWKLMAACGSGTVSRRQWIPMAKRKQISKVQQFMLEWYPNANNDELDLLTQSMTRDDFENFVKSTGATDSELEDILAAHDKETGFKPEKTGKGKKRASNE